MHIAGPCLAAFVALAAATPVAAQSLQQVPPLAAWVTDLTGTLQSAERAALEDKLQAFEARKGAQIAVLIVPTTQPEAIEQYSIRVVDAWKLGREKPDDGALLLVAMQDRTLRIEVGRGLEGALTDLVANRIIDETITPRFREGDFSGGIDAGVDRMIQVIDGEPLPEPEQHWDGAQGLASLLPILFMVVLVGSAILRALFGRALGSLATGGVAGGLAWWVTQLLGVSIGVGLVGLVLSLALGFGGGGRWSSGPRHGGWTTGGWGGGGFRGSGGGGFSGGGGSFGGGGASGRW
ncbi:MAG: YgcG family protein [Gammaproteobacteria bacterium]|nr:YgcG family protein [Gammaproteobacteria bacterium]